MDLQKTLDVGCGDHCHPGATGIDIRPSKKNPSQLVHNLNRAPWPLPQAHFEKVICQHVIEHVEDLQILVSEMHRVSKPGAEIHFITPHYSSYASWGDPTHRWHFALGSIPQLFEQVLGAGRFVVTKNEIRFTGSGLDLFGWLIYKLSPKTYEKHFAWIFPANEIHTSVRVGK